MNKSSQTQSTDLCMRENKYIFFLKILKTKGEKKGWISKRKAEKSSGEAEKDEGKKNEKKKERQRELLGAMSVSGMGPTNSVKNIKWWQVSDGAEQVWYFKVMSDE